MTVEAPSRAARALGTAAALLVAAVGALAVTTGAAAPAQAAACTSGKGVTVVVDRGALGGGVSAVCVSGGAGQSAWALLDGAFGVDGVQRQPGFICRVGGAPADAACVNTPPADAYWGLYHSNGKSGTWTYSTTGAGSLKAVEGGYVAVSWQDGGSADVPGLSPAVHKTSTPTPKPTATSTPKPTATPTPDQGGNSAADDGAGSEDAGGTEGNQTDTEAKGGKGAKPAKGKKKRPQTDASTTQSADEEPLTEETEPATASDEPADEGGIPAVVTFGVLGALAVAGGAAAVVSRRRRDA